MTLFVELGIGIGATVGGYGVLYGASRAVGYLEAIAENAEEANEKADKCLRHLEGDPNIDSDDGLVDEVEEVREIAEGNELDVADLRQTVEQEVASAS